MSQVIQGSNHPYFTIKLKTVVDHYNTHEQKQLADYQYFQGNKSKFSASYTEENFHGAKFYNSNRVSLMEDPLCSIIFKIDENPPLDIRDLKNKGQGAYIATDYIRWMEGNKEIYIKQSNKKNSTRGNIYGHYRSYATNSLGEPY